MRFIQFMMLSLLAGIFLFLAYPANYSLEQIRAKLTSYTREHVADKVYLHTDKDVFLPGDTLWYKAWCINPDRNVLKEKSQNLVVQVVPPEGEPILTRRHRIEQGGAQGHLVLPETADLGTYRLLAYTGLMKQKDCREAFSRSIQVLDHLPKIFLQSSRIDSVYKADEEVTASLYVYNELKQPLREVPFSYHVQSGKKQIYKGSDSTNSRGFKKVRFRLPETLPSEPILLTVHTDYRGYQAHHQTVIPTRRLRIRLRFFPESGHLLKGRNNRVAFKATDSYGSPVDFRGLLLDQNNQVIKKIRSFYRGMGSFEVNLEKHPQAKVQITHPINQSSSYSLPDALEQGYAIHMDHHDKDRLHLILRATEQLTGKKVTLLAQMQGTIHWSKSFSINKTTTLTIPTKQMPMGILKLTLLDAKGMPRAERLTFCNKHKRLYIEVSTDKEKYHPKDPVRLNIRVTNHQGEPTAAHLSLAVTNRQRLGQPAGIPDLMAYNYLTSEIRGEIGTPNVYFRDNPRADTAINHLMMTHGWRRYRWEQVLNTPTDANIKKRLPFFTGRILRNNGKPAKKAIVKLFKPRFEIDEKLLLQTVESENSAVQLNNPKYFRYIKKVTGKEGYFHLSASEYAQVMDTGKIYIMAERRNGKKDIQFKFVHSYARKLADHYREHTTVKSTPTLSVFVPNPLIPLKKDLSMEKDYYSRFDENAVMLEEIVVSAKRPVKIPDEVRKQRYQVLEKSAEDIEKQTGGAPRNFLSLLRTVTSGFTVDHNKILFRGYNSILPGQQSGALIVLDGINMGENYHNVDFLNAEDIDKIKVIKNAGSALKYTSQNRGGLIAIETKDGAWKKKASASKDADNPTTTLQGYALKKDFYAPEYPSREAKLNRVDLRQTLYWNPDIRVDTSGSASVTFYNSDIKMEAVCRVQGRNGGKLGSKRDAFVVY
ncbi:MAG: TonB-dependent receptor plug domain-containing protein [Bacteroidales bacterium]|nr:TonB-dependent receptor plug domain-containing protein [Bacteroidales bacterium]